MREELHRRWHGRRAHAVLDAHYSGATTQAQAGAWLAAIVPVQGRSSAVDETASAPATEFSRVGLPERWPLIVIRPLTF